MFQPSSSAFDRTSNSRFSPKISLLDNLVLCSNLLVLPRRVPFTKLRPIRVHRYDQQSFVPARTVASNAWSSTGPASLDPAQGWSSAALPKLPSRKRGRSSESASSIVIGTPTTGVTSLVNSPAKRRKGEKFDCGRFLEADWTAIEWPDREFGAVLYANQALDKVRKKGKVNQPVGWPQGEC